MVEPTQPNQQFKVNLSYRQESIDDIHTSILKSALQKCIRRGERDIGLTALGYLAALDDSTPQGKRMRTNITNRFIVCMSEEVSINEWRLPARMKDLYDKFSSCRSNVDASVTVWIEMMRLLMMCKKCRVVSDYKTRFNLPPYKIKYEKLEPMWKTLLIKNDLSIPPLYKDLKDAKRCFTTLLRECKDECFDPLRYILNNGKAVDITYIFNAIKEAVPLMKNQISALEFFYKKMTHAEKPIYLYNAILYVLHLDKIDVKQSLPIVLSEFTPDDIRKMAHEHTKKHKTFPDYVYDKHTTSNTDGKTSLTFALEGAQIPNENTTFMNQSYRNLYIDFKKIQVAAGYH